MKLLNRLKFAWKYDIEPDFILHDFDNQSAVRFLKYEDAQKFQQEQFKYAPKIMVEVTRKK